MMADWNHETVMTERDGKVKRVEWDRNSGGEKWEEAKDKKQGMVVEE